LLRLPVGVVVVDRRYDIQAINNAARRLLGVHRTAVGEDFIHLVQQVPSASLRAIIDAAFRREPAVEVYEVPPPDATAEPRHIEVSCSPETIDGKDGPLDSVMIVVTDVTARVREQRELQQAYEQQRVETQHLAAQMARVAEINRQLIEANQELTGANADLLSANEEMLVSNEEVQAATEEVETLNEELQATNEELETLNEELQATVEELNTTNDDLEARSADLQEIAATLEQQRHASEMARRRLDAILANMTDAVLVVDREGTAVLTNDAYDRAFGALPANAVLTDREGRPLPAGATLQERAARGESFSMELTSTATDGTRRWFEAVGQPIRPNGENVSVVVIRDITDRSLRRLHDHFLATASHELRTPLTALTGYLQMMVRQMATGRIDDERQRRFADQALAQARRLATLVNDLVDVTRLQNDQLTLRLEPVDLDALVKATADVAQGLAQGQKIEVEADDGSVIVNGDSGRLEQVLLNLLNNALTHASESERLILRLRRLDGQAEIQVQDFGPGIPAGQLPDLFSRFYRAERPGGRSHTGLGLGLFIARELVAAHGGTIDVESREGEGTTFTVRLPLVESNTVHTATC
jgi:two-component system, chemotaxis family, CheB/CheR fusion protein